MKGIDLPPIVISLVKSLPQLVSPSPWENGYIESFNGKLRDGLLNREIFTTLNEVSIRIASN